MAIQILCECGRKLRLDEKNAGKKARCPACGNEFRIPAQGTESVGIQARPSPPIEEDPPEQVPARRRKRPPDEEPARTRKRASKEPVVEPPFEMTTREKWGFVSGIVVAAFSALLASGIVPNVPVLPFPVWLAIATIGCALAGVIATPLWWQGALAGALTGAGVMSCVCFLVAIMGGFSVKIATLIGIMIGGFPGIVLYALWARPKNEH